MEPTKKVKKPFKFQNVLKLNNRILEENLKTLAIQLTTILAKTEDTKLKIELSDALCSLSIIGARADRVVKMQKGLNHLSSQEELEALFKVVTEKNDESKIGMLKVAMDKFTTAFGRPVQPVASDKDKNDDDCNCPACTLRKALEGIAGKVGKAKKSKAEPVEKEVTETSVKVFEINVPKGINPKEIVDEVISKLSKGK